ncbi:MAG: tetraacyldisaccharide 4'-kinase [Parashewanella sp.]
MQNLVHKIWYQGHWLQWLLWPFSWLFALVSGLRRTSFKLGISKQQNFSVPIIIVGNITAGGSGKTPMVIYLIELLRSKGFTPGVVSRGYGADIDDVLMVSDKHSAKDVGDEPAMIFARTKVPMVVGAKRVNAAKRLLKESNVDVIISDDGLQHYALTRDIEIAIIDGERQLGNEKLIPAGPLRESKHRLSSVDFVVVNGVRSDKHQYLMKLQPSDPICLDVTEPSQQLEPSTSLVAMAGIGNPQRFFNTLQQLGFHVDSQHAFADHQAYKHRELAALAVNKPLIMTEKDAIKCKGFAEGNWWYLPVNAELPSNFDNILIDKLTQISIRRN